MINPALIRSTRVFLVTIFTFVSGGVVLGQSTGSITGTVLDPGGNQVADAPIRARNDAAGIDVRTRSAQDGRYEFGDLPSGVYVVSVNMPCCEFFPFVDDSVLVNAGSESIAKVELVAFNLDVEGDNPATVNAELASRQDIPDLPVPRMPDGRPDLTGVWLFVDDPYPEDPIALEWVEPVVQERIENLFISAPPALCLPDAALISGGSAFIVKFVQRPELLVALREDVAGFRQIFLDGRAHPERLDPSWMGHSIGYWEGDTLVVDTIGFNDRGWTDIYPRTESLHMQERYTRIDYGRLEVVATFDDPGVFQAPWTRRMVWNLATDIELMEYVCENNQWQDAGQ
jgi:hypothetical protein